MATVNGWRNTVITALIAVVVCVPGTAYLVGGGKADKGDVKEHRDRPAHEQQLVLNAQTEARLATLEKTQEQILEKVKALPNAVADELERRER
jgi:UDP-N-acetylmuramoylalanine-D-glutamate ligase